MRRIARRFVVHGQVQGVGFRWWTRSLAQELELHGSVRNRDDGTVELVASGGEPDLQELRRRLHEGPPGAVVERVEEEAVATAPGGSGFHILR